MHYRLPGAFSEHGLDVSFRKEHRVSYVRDRDRAVSVFDEIRFYAFDQFVGVFRLIFVRFVRSEALAAEKYQQLFDVKFNQLLAAERRVGGAVHFTEVHVVEFVGKTIAAFSYDLVQYRFFRFAQGKPRVFESAHRGAVATESHDYGVRELLVRADIVVLAGLVKIALALRQNERLVARGDLRFARVDIHEFPKVVAFALKRELLSVAEIMHRVQTLHVDYARRYGLFVHGRVCGLVCRFHSK